MKYLISLLTLAGLLTFGSSLFAGDKVKFNLTPGGIDTEATAKVTIDGDKLKVKLKDAQPDTLYTVWIDFRNRAAGKVPPPDFPVAYAQQVAPAFGSRDPVYDGMRLDLNTIVTDENGKGELNRRLDYELLTPYDSPVVGMSLAVEGLNRVGGYWLRTYPVDPFISASNQTTDSNGDPLLVRSTAQGITIVRHPDFISHGHTPGVKNVDHYSAFSGDFPAVDDDDDGKDGDDDNDDDYDNGKDGDKDD